MPRSSYPYRYAQVAPFPGKPVTRNPRFSVRDEKHGGLGLFRNLLLIAAVYHISGCIITPRFDNVQPVTFNSPAPNQQQLSYEDLLCCEECKA